MSKKQFRSQASSGRAAFGAGFGGGAGGAAGFGGSTFGAHASPLSYIQEVPDLSGVSDPNVAVTFKNLAKKDSTTKAKALEELQSYVASPGVDVEDVLLAAWVCFNSFCSSSGSVVIRVGQTISPTLHRHIPSCSPTLAFCARPSSDKMRQTSSTIHAEPSTALARWSA